MELKVKTKKMKIIVKYSICRGFVHDQSPAQLLTFLAYKSHFLQLSTTNKTFYFAR